MATYKNLTTRGRLGKSAAPTFYFWTPSISPKLIELGRSASGEISSSQFLFWDPLHISVTYGAKKLKFGTLVVIYEY